MPSRLTRRYEKVRDVSELPEITVQQIQHFFEHYKDLETNKWVKLDRWEGADVARGLITDAIERARQKGY